MPPEAPPEAPPLLSSDRLDPSRRQTLALALAAAGAVVADTPSSAATAATVAGSPVVQASVAVGPAPVGVVGGGFAGLSYEKATVTERLFTAANADLVGLFRRLGPSLLRLGGNTVERQVWTAGGRGGVPGQIAPADVDALAGFLKASGWRCLYGVNLAGAATNATSPVLAAEEVKYVARALGSSLAGIEIGNEPDLYGDIGYFPRSTWNAAAFEALWRRYRDAIVAATPGVTVTGPSTAGSVQRWTAPFASAEKGQFEWLTHHYYRANGLDPTSTAARLVTPDGALGQMLAALKQAGTAAGTPVRLSECNSFYNGGAHGASNAYASALWGIDFLFSCAQGGLSGVNFHGGGQSAYTPIADHDNAVVGVRPLYYGLALFHLMGSGTLRQTAVYAGGRNVSAYAITSPSRGLRVVLVNKDPTEDLEVTVYLHRSATRASGVALTQLSPGASGPSLTATSGVILSGAAIGPDGSWTPEAAEALTVADSQVKVRLPRLSAMLVTVS